MERTSVVAVFGYPLLANPQEACTREEYAHFPCVTFLYSLFSVFMSMWTVQSSSKLFGLTVCELRLILSIVGHAVIRILLYIELQVRNIN
jgi:hypothetical protein